MFGKTYNNCVKKEEVEIQESDKKERVVVRKMLAIIRLSQDTLYGQVHMHQVH